MSALLSQHDSWLRCQVEKGMFSDEVAVSYPTEGTVLHSVFVPASTVRGRIGENGRVRVKVVNKSGAVYAVLPTEQSEVVEVKREDLSENP